MKRKASLVVGLGVGYVLGSRAGREHYEKLKAGVAKVWNDPKVRSRVDAAATKAKEAAPSWATDGGDEESRTPESADTTALDI